MKLVLVINNTSTLENGSKATATFEKTGGSIGSGAQCHWQLMDRHNSVSREHVRVFFQDGVYCAEAVGDEGIIVNGSNRPIPSGQRFRISDGDVWKVGAFKLTTYVIAEGSELEDHSEQWAGRFAAIDTIVSGHLQDEDEQSQSNIEYILADRLESDLSEDFFASNQRSNALLCDPVEVLDQQDEEGLPGNQDPLSQLNHDSEPEQQEQDEDLLGTLGLQPEYSGKAVGIDDPQAHHRLMIMPQAKGNHAMSTTSTEPVDPEMDSYLESLTNSGGQEMLVSDIQETESWHGSVSLSETGEEGMVDHVVLRPLLSALGLPIGDMSLPEANRITQEVGAALKTAISGLMSIHAQQWEDRSSMNDTHLHPVEDNPIRLAQSPEQAIEDLLLVQSPVHLNAPSAIEESLMQIELHEKASRIAADEALEAVLFGLSPENLTKRFARYKGHAPRTGDLDSWNWQMYEHYYNEMRSGRQRGLTRMFWEIFRQVYDREMRSHQLCAAE
ncbi:type VI secretion system-associated FHA domain protein TagH [Pseudovibrio sp. JE062]|uniref:type VI secretion system-associated FHA domain protein TagH n=1 Tax=Pseudovibrio sp. JE062 TaxID=439495 RepID=UPI000186BCB7|nr:type VI secretion system-associated FHA domain protein TagH [Pseudovibrio sp. JE062]EEA94504.1 type VI secretion system FHA domain protein [Pseudovibrio sp. JE062]